VTESAAALPFAIHRVGGPALKHIVIRPPKELHASAPSPPVSSADSRHGGEHNSGACPARGGAVPGAAAGVWPLQRAHPCRRRRAGEAAARDRPAVARYDAVDDVCVGGNDCRCNAVGADRGRGRSHAGAVAVFCAHQWPRSAVVWQGQCADRANGMRFPAVAPAGGDLRWCFGAALLRWHGGGEGIAALWTRRAGDRDSTSRVGP
jgi:hypothetical protein